MTRTIAALFDNNEQAQKAFKDLKDNGYREDEMWLISQGARETFQNYLGKDRRQKAAKETIESMGLKEEQAEVNDASNGTLFVVTCPDDRADRAVNLINQYKPLGVEGNASSAPGDLK